MPTTFDEMLTIECAICGRKKFCNGDTEQEALKNAHGWKRLGEDGIICPMCRPKQSGDDGRQDDNPTTPVSLPSGNI